MRVCEAGPAPASIFVALCVPLGNSVCRSLCIVQGADVGLLGAVTDVF